ncbi:MAG: lipase family protein [Maricaulaceae bacterium]|jgi:carboxypeptidase C (cathepsin A)
MKAVVSAGVCVAVALAVAGCAGAPSALGAEAEAGPAAPHVEVARSGVFNGVSVDYVAAVEETVLENDDGAPAVSMVSTSYTAAGDAADPNRPVVFMFNGGPGAASVWLHMGAFGPRRVVLPADPADPVEPPFEVVDNEQTILDVADLVIIDPPGTGYSRILPDGDPATVYSAYGDGQLTADFIAAWLATHDRSGAPVYILGESYGTIRTVIAADALGDLEAPVELAGLILIGQAVNIVETVQRPANAVGQTANLPTLAAIAWRHGRVDRAGRSFEAFLDEVRDFAADEYLVALVQGHLADESVQSEIAARLESYTGVSADYFLDNQLRISKLAFREELLRDEGLVLGYQDARYIGAEGDPAGAVQNAYLEPAREHFEDWLGVSEDFEYRVRLEDGPNDWSYGGPTSPFNHFNFAQLLSDAMADNPDMKLMIASGYFDLTTTFGAAEHLAATTDLPLERVELNNYPGGHMLYSDEESFLALMSDIRRVIAGEIEGWRGP